MILRIRLFCRTAFSSSPAPRVRARRPSSTPCALPCTDARRACATSPKAKTKSCPARPGNVLPKSPSKPARERSAATGASGGRGKKPPGNCRPRAANFPTPFRVRSSKAMFKAWPTKWRKPQGWTSNASRAPCSLRREGSPRSCKRRPISARPFWNSSRGRKSIRMYPNAYTRGSCSNATDSKRWKRSWRASTSLRKRRNNACIRNSQP